MPTLLVLRHAKSSWGKESLPDHERPLNARGRRDAPRIALHLAHAAPQPVQVLCSTAVRARQTLDAVLDALPKPVSVSLEPELYLAPAGALLTRLQALPHEADPVLLVGHNPGLEDLVQSLAERGEELAMRSLREGLKTATLAVLECPAPWAELAPRSAHLAALVRPQDLETD